MKSENPTWLFLLLLACAAVFVYASAQELPDPLASHFQASGAANGYLPKTIYVRLMLVLLVGAPGLLVLVTRSALARPNARINLPHSDYWLAPERRAATIAALQAGVMRFGTLLVVFLCYAHWLVVRANRIQPPQLTGSWFVGGLVFFLCAMLLFTWRLLRRFRR
jgi:uncharacterized membrane protein